MANADALFGMGVGGATSSPSTPSMRVAYSSDGTAVYKSVPPGSSPPPSYHHQPSPASTGGGSEVHMAPHGLNMNVVIGGGPDLQQQQQQPSSMMMMMKKKRGRPRKYEGAGGGGGPTDGTMPLSLMPAATSAPRPATPASAPPPVLDASGGGGGAFSPPSGGGGGSGAGSEASFKKRGRPPGSMNKKKPDHHQPIHAQPLGSAGVGFTPHVISVQAGEDVSAKIMTFSQNGPRAVCILSANGSISNVTLRQAATSGGTATYEGRFEILSLCGSFLLTEVGGQRSRTGGLSVSLAGPDGRVLGGCVAGLLTAAAPVQVIVGSFIPDGRKETKPPQNHHVEQPNNNQFSSPPIPMPMPMSMSMPSMLFSTSGGGGGGNYGGPTGGVSSGSPSQGGSLSESSGGEGSSPPPPNHNTVGNNNNHNNSNPQGMLGMPWR